MRRALAALCAMLIGLASPAAVDAARPLLDSHQWDSYFALFARDQMVPWKHPSVRLDTYSGAPVDLAAYAVDPVEVIVAGTSSRPRAIDTAHRTPVARWRFTPPGGYQFEANDVELPLVNREGFYVVEARRGSASQQVWVNLSRIGLVTRESAGGIVVYACDLATGRALGGMRLAYLVGTRLVTTKTDAHGVSRAPAGPRARFALAEWGRSVAFVSFLAQSPVPPAIVGVRLERTVLHAGEHARVVGFVRRRTGEAYRAATGEVRLALVARGRTLAQSAFHLDPAGAFAGELTVPPQTPTGDAAVIATAGTATGGASLHIDAEGDATLAVSASCGAVCDATAPIPLVVRANRTGYPAANVNVRVRVVRTPHILPPGEAEDVVRWGTTTVIDRAVTTNAEGSATLRIPEPTDGLDSTYAVTVSTSSANASARVVAPAARVALAVEPDAARLDVGASAGVSVRAFDALDGTPVSGNATLKLVHGVRSDAVAVRLDPSGRGHAIFHSPSLGTNMVVAEMETDGKKALDASSFRVEPSALEGGSGRAAASIALSLDRTRYRPGERVGVSASLPGASGDAFVTLDGAQTYEALTVGVRDGRASAALPLGETLGDDRVNVVLVRDGAIYQANVVLAVDGPGHPRATVLAPDRTAYAPGETAHITIHDGGGPQSATYAWRLSDTRPNRGAAFDDAPQILAASATAGQAPADADQPSWHAWVAPARSTAGNLFGFDRPRAVASPDAALALSAPRTLAWRVEHERAAALDLKVPAERGRYVLSVMKVAEDGDVGAASVAIVVR